MRLRTSAYDQASSLLVAALIMLVVLVGCLVLIYFARTLVISQVAIEVKSVDLGLAGRAPDTPRGLAQDIEPPKSEEIPELIEPQLQETLSAVLSATTERQAVISSETFDSAATAGTGTGLGDNRDVGDGGLGNAREPQREMRFEAKSIEEYAELLDFFGMEIAVLGRDNRVYYASQFTKPLPTVRDGDPSADLRLYFNSAGGPLAGLDRQLAQKAGIADRGPFILVYTSPTAEAKILQLEQAAAGGKPKSKIMRTAFRVKHEGTKFTFSVEQQDYYP